MYYVGVFVGYTFWSFYMYWLKHDQDPSIAFDRKYLHTWFMTTIIAVAQLLMELMTVQPIVLYSDAFQAFVAGFALYFFIQEFIKGILKNPRTDYFNK